MKKEKTETKTGIKSIICPCCGETTFKDEFEICKVCGWQYNLVQLDDPDCSDGPNKLSLNQTKEWFSLKRKYDPKYTWKAHAKKDGNPTLYDLDKLRESVRKTESENDEIKKLLTKNFNSDDIVCPVCGEYKFEYFGDICPICGWEHCVVQSFDFDYAGFANSLSLNEHKKIFEENRKNNSSYKWDDDPKKYESYRAKK